MGTTGYMHAAKVTTFSRFLFSVVAPKRDFICMKTVTLRLVSRCSQKEIDFEQLLQK